MKTFFTTVILSCFIWAFTYAASQKQATVSLIGNVRSADNRTLPKAKVVVVYEPSGAKRTGASDAAGNFTIENLAVGGPYTVSVTQPNFEPEIVRNVFFVEGQNANGTFVLHPAGKSGEASTAERPPVAGPHAMPPVAGYYPYTYIRQIRLNEPAPAAPPVAEAAPAPAAPRARYRTYQPPTRPTVRAEALDVKGHYDPKSGDFIYDTGKPTDLNLPNGKKISSVGINSTETKLFRFLTDASAKIDTADLTKGWINFDRVYFDTGKASLTKESMQQLRNLALMLKSYPNARVKIGGYTDSTGTYKVNRQLSEARARSAWAVLVDMGVSPSQIEARGYGWNYAIASNKTEEGRAMNRRLSVKVLTK